MNHPGESGASELLRDRVKKRRLSGAERTCSTVTVACIGAAMTFPIALKQALDANIKEHRVGMKVFSLTAVAGLIEEQGSGSSARRDLCRGHLITGVRTAAVLLDTQHAEEVR